MHITVTELNFSSNTPYSGTINVLYLKGKMVVTVIKIDKLSNKKVLALLSELNPINLTRYTAVIR